MDDKKAANPGGKQLELEYPSQRGNQLRDLKDLRLGDPYCRWILVVLDFHINQQLGYWDLSHKELMAACELSRSVYYDRLRRLKERCLISVDDLPDSTKKRFRIIRSNVAEVACHHRQAGTKATGVHLVRSAKHRRPISGLPVHVQDSTVQNADQSVPLADAPVQNKDRSVLLADGSILLNPTDNNCPSTATLLTGMATAADVIREMEHCGVDHPTPAVETAIKRGCSPTELMEIVCHFRDLVARNDFEPFEPGALQRRITHHSPSMSINAGWPKAKPRSVPQQDLEAAFGPKLNALQGSENQLAGIIDRHGTATMRQIMRHTSAKAMAQSDQWRPYLLQILQQLEELR